MKVTEDVWCFGIGMAFGIVALFLLAFDAPQLAAFSAGAGFTWYCLGGMMIAARKMGLIPAEVGGKHVDEFHR